MKLLVLIPVVIVILVSGCTQYQQSLQKSPEQLPVTTKTPEKTVSTSPISTEVTQTTQLTESVKSTFDYSRLPKYANKYYRYSKQAYDSAISEGKVVYLYFYANWCPICKEARPKILEAFNSVDYPDVIGFEVHYNDDEEKDFDKEITKSYQVPYQHTTIIAKDKEQKYRSLQALTKEEIIKELESARIP